ncbi:hypothetical protein V144x_44920 [Gimesia aquarii]|uniref:Uncharacterized protein n=1 Tax=Gimesia aquarii TaxID=2527964 RepID=A0A517W150_9PLAN|nr:hypothetical protein V144x_44920 [Gimesia aquarii]
MKFNKYLPILLLGLTVINILYIFNLTTKQSFAADPDPCSAWCQFQASSHYYLDQEPGSKCTEDPVSEDCTGSCEWLLSGHDGLCASNNEVPTDQVCLYQEIIFTYAQILSACNTECDGCSDRLTGNTIGIVLNTCDLKQCIDGAPPPSSP